MTQAGTSKKSDFSLEVRKEANHVRRTWTWTGPFTPLPSAMLTHV